MRFCTNCGGQIDDQATFCTNCGAAAPAAQQQAPVAQQPTYQQPAYQAPAQPQPAAENPLAGLVDKVKKTDPKKLAIPAVIAVAVIALIIIIVSAAGAYKRPVGDYTDMLSGKASKAQFKRMYPKEVWEYYDDEWDSSFEDQYEEYQDEKDDLIDELEDEYGKNFRISYKITDKDKWDEDDLDDLKERLNETYDIKESAVKKAYEIDVEMKIKGREDDDENEVTLNVVKIGSKWYLLRF